MFLDRKYKIMATVMKNQPVQRKYKVKKWMVFMIVAAICISVGFAAFQLKPATDTLEKEEKSTTKGLVVSVNSVKPATYAANITALGEVVPSIQITLKSQIEGQVVFLSDQLDTGNMVKKGELLVRIEQSAFQLQVAEANNRLAAATITLLREEREEKDARINWQQSGMEGDPASPLVLREPQLAAARMEVKAAKASLFHAKVMLEQTEIRAPFDAMIIRRNINPGETLFTADEIATLFGVESFEISVHIDQTSWALLPESLTDTGVKLLGTGQSASWQAAIIRKSYHLDHESRLRTLILQVQHPLDSTPQLLPGTFVRAEITGRQVQDLLQIPESAFTKQGLVWFVDRKKQLHKYQLEPLFYGNGVVYVSVPERIEDSPFQVAVSPNASFVNGLHVKPLQEKGIQDDT